MTVAVGQQMKADDLLKLTFFPVGTVLMFSGSWTNGTGGWYICDGTNGTPNLVGKFIKGGASSGVGGGKMSHSFTVSSNNLPSHTHADSGHSHSHNHTTHTGSVQHIDKGPTNGFGSASGVFSTSGNAGRQQSSDGSARDAHYQLSFSAAHNTDSTIGKAVLDKFGSDSPMAITIPTEPEYYSLVYIMKVKSPSEL